MLCKIFMSIFIRIFRMKYDQGPGIRKSFVGATGKSFVIHSTYLIPAMCIWNTTICCRVNDVFPSNTLCDFVTLANDLFSLYGSISQSINPGCLNSYCMIYVHAIKHISFLNIYMMIARRYRCRHVTILQVLNLLFPSFISQAQPIPTCGWRQFKPTGRPTLLAVTYHHYEN